MKNRSGASKDSGLAFAFTAPAFLVMGAMVLYPFVFNVVISFSNMSLTHFKDWSLVGPQNYLQVLADRAFAYTLFKTVLWTVVNVFFHVLIGVSLALVLNKNIKGKSVFRSVTPNAPSVRTWK